MVYIKFDNRYKIRQTAKYRYILRQWNKSNKVFYKKFNTTEPFQVAGTHGKLLLDL